MASMMPNSNFSANPRPQLPGRTQNPTFGIHRISQLLRRWFLLAASPTTVRQRLQAAQLMSPAPRVKQRNLTRPRFFERATPNQLWQTDIFTCRLGGRYA